MVRKNLNNHPIRVEEENMLQLRENMLIKNKKYPQWGMWRVLNKYADGIWEIRGDRGDRVLMEGETYEWEETKI